MGSSLSPFPLENASDHQLRKLGQILWGWQLCGSCEARYNCKTTTCPWQRSKRLARFFEYYRDATSSYVPELLPGSHPALRAHEDVLEIIQLLKVKPDIPRSQLTHSYFASRGGGQVPLPPLLDQERAFNLAVRVMAMVNCSVQPGSSGLLECGSRPIPWRSNVSLTQFMANAFPTTDHPSLNDTDPSGEFPDIKAALTAKKLKKCAGLRFQPTDDLRNHLKLDRKQGVVEIYHHTAFLKEYLTATQSAPKGMSITDSARLGIIPRQLVLETLDSLQKILFPPDPESQSLLRSLASKASFDPDCLRFESAPNRYDDEKNIAYYYFGSRLADLYDEIENPRPRGLVEKWVERRSGSRYIMMATLIGVVTAVMLGLAGLAVGIFQAWVGYQQWQHPLTNGGVWRPNAINPHQG
ncbi:MAG: hypothetical protein M1813_008246 [Trichoglossum hirsutum]|nr:MAG: hypothetical protein M1813_008246 [Trichoglossum hirsutum]